MNIKEFLNNPTGKGSVIPGKGAILDDLDRRYKSLLTRGDFEVKVYKNKNNIYYHIIIKTEDTERENDYDIVLEFIPNKQNKNDSTVKNFDIKFFSNCPSFVYTYAYVANLNKLLITSLSNKYDKKILKYPPVSRNPHLMMGYEKSIYFACKFLMENNMLINAYIDSHIDKNFSNLNKSIRKDNVILEEIQRAKAKKKVKKEDDKKLQRNIQPIKHIGKSQKTKSGVNYIKPSSKNTKNGKITHVGKSKKSKSSVNKIKKR